MTVPHAAGNGTAVTTELREALEAAAGIVGRDRVVALPGRLGNNTGLFRQRRILGTIRPRTGQEVQEVVTAFGRSAGTAPLHVYSTGRNWGLGSREPATDDAVALDLSGLDQVREINIDAGWAVIEPGVTQGHMAKLLTGTDRMVNVTVSSAHSSLVGNALDRGVGLRHQRVDDLVGLEVVLPDGEVMYVGWWPDAGRQRPVYSHGLGPSLVQMFVQSNLVVVTAAAIRLLSRPEALRVVRLTFTPDKLADAITHLRRWVGQGLVDGVPKIYNPAAAAGYGSTPGQFLVHVCVNGISAAVDALTSVLVDEATRSGAFSEISASDSTDRANEQHEVTTLVEQSYWGDPDVTDTVFEAKMGMAADELDNHIGFLFFLPLVPFAPDCVVLAEELLRRVQNEFGISCGGTLNVIGPDVIDFAITMKFDRVHEIADRAHRALDRLYELFTDAGFMPYRLDVDHHDWMLRCGGAESERSFARRLKQMIDPTTVIAPGRYS